MAKKSRKRPLILSLLFVSAVFVTAGLFLIPWLFNRYIDGFSIDQSSREALIRNILWEKPEPLKGSLNLDEECYEPTISPDGLTMIFTLGKAGDNGDLYISELMDRQWTTPKPLSTLNTPYEELGPELSRDNQYLYFYSNRPGGFGGYDIWVSRRDGENRWSPPENLGQGVNTGFNEYGPAVSHNGATLYFSSNRLRRELTEKEKAAWKATLRESFPGTDYDIFSAEIAELEKNALVDDQKPPFPEFQKAKRLDILNSMADEGQPALTPRGDFIYFASSRQGGNGRV